MKNNKSFNYFYNTRLTKYQVFSFSSIFFKITTKIAKFSTRNLFRGQIQGIEGCRGREQSGSFPISMVCGPSLISYFLIFGNKTTKFIELCVKIFERLFVVSVLRKFDIKSTPISSSAAMATYVGYHVLLRLQKRSERKDRLKSTFIQEFQYKSY